MSIDFSLISEYRSGNRITPESGSEKFPIIVEDYSEDIEAAVIKLRLSSRPDSLRSQSGDPFSESGSEKFPIIVEDCSEDIEPAFSKLHLSSRPDSLSSQSGDPFSESGSEKFPTIVEDCSEDIEPAFSKLRLSSSSPFSALLAFCRLSAPSTFLDVLIKYRDTKRIVKVGEGTFGEAFKVGGAIFKIVPFDPQKKSEELLEEVMLSSTLNHLRGCETHASNTCTSFIHTMDWQVCCGPYDAALIEAWEKWDEEHESENDNPKDLPDNQCYVVFVQEHGGQDLESFKLLNYNEARSLLVQVTLALAVAEAAYEFEHRDLHWGNILIRRRGDSESMCFTLEGRKIHIKTYGLSISLIDFTLSRLKTGDDILFLDLSLDPELFDGPKGHKQFDTYRKMKEFTDECWEGSFPKTNVLWLEYLIHMLIFEKSIKRRRKDEDDGKDIREFKNRLWSYNSAKEVVADVFIRNLCIRPNL